MSGHGGGGSGGEAVPVLSCANLSGKTQLNSPQPEIVGKLNIGDNLELILNGTTVEAHFNDEVAGTITWTQLAQLIECIEEGNDYIAQVTNISGGSVQVHIRSV